MNESTVLTLIRGSLDDSLKPWISIKNPRTIDELMIEVQNAERAEREEAERHSYSNSTKNPMLKMVKALTLNVQNLTHQIERMKIEPNANGSVNYEIPNQQMIPVRNRQFIQCYYCGQYRHSQRMPGEDS